MEETAFAYQTIVDNVSMIDDDLLHQINLLVVEHGHKLLKKMKNKAYSLKQTVMF
jgi:hypothetical protein